MSDGVVKSDEIGLGEEYVAEMVARLQSGVEIRDRTWMLRSFSKCFVGSEMVDWLVQSGEAESREEAVALGQLLLEGGRFAHVTGDHAFKDARLFYRWAEDFPKKKRLPPVTALASWAHLVPSLMVASEEAAASPNPSLPNGFLTEDMAAMLEQLELAPLDEHNARLLDAVHPANHGDPVAENIYGLVVVGAGAGGLVTTAIAASLGAKVALVEERLLGGDCLNTGCVPSKALLAAAHAVARIRDAAALGVVVGDVSVDFGAVMERMRRLRADISKNDSVERFEGLGADIYLGRASFTGTHSLEVNGQTLRFRRAVIATGGVPAVPPITGLLEAKPLTSDSVFNLTQLPPSMAVIGSGAIGCEIAQAFANFGCKVTMIVRSDRILSREESEAAALVEEALKRDGVHILHNTNPISVEVQADGLRLIQLDGGHGALAVAEVLVATGRRPTVENMGLDQAKVQFDKRKGVLVDDHLRTSNSDIYAVGDCCTAYKFTHVADFMARLVIRNALFLGNGRMSQLLVPYCTYTRPEVAHVGLYAVDLESRNEEYDIYERRLEEVDRAILEGTTGGYVRVLTKRGSDRILGCTIVADNAGDMISEVTLAMNNGIGLAGIAQSIHPYPTVAEALRQVGDLYGRTRLTPGVRVLLRGLLAARRKTAL